MPQQTFDSRRPCSCSGSCQPCGLAGARNTPRRASRQAGDGSEHAEGRTYLIVVNPNDEIRNQILRYFYGRNESATSRYGKKGSAVKISDAKRELKIRHRLSQQQVMSNLTYLIDRGWVKTVEIEKTVRVKGGTVPSTVTWYEIAASGIEKIEGESEFTPRERYPGINITASGSNVIQLGDGNVVNAQFSQLHTQLQSLKQAVSGSPSLSDADKLDIAADIETLKDQLAKPQPNKTVIGALWGTIEKAAAVAGLVDYASRIAPLIYGLLPR